MTEPATDNAAEMRAIAISAPGEPDVLREVRTAMPAPAADEVLIRVVAAGVNRPDCLQRRGLYPPPPGVSELPGLEVAGAVQATGAEVDTFEPGDPVCALLAGGGYAEYCAAPTVQCLPIPAGLTFTEAAIIPETFFTVWTNVFDRGKLQAGEKILVHGGASGIGTTAIQLARAVGADVYATAGNDEKVALCEHLGAKRAINYNADDFARVITEETGGAGIDLVFDIVGGAYLDRNLELLAKDGRLVVIGVLGGAKAELNLSQVLLKRLTITGSTLRSRPASEKGAIAMALKEHVWPLLENGEVKPVLQQSWGLEEAAAAHTLLEANGAAGKLALIVDPALADTVAA